MHDEDAVKRGPDIEAIKQLKASYFLYLDTNDWEAWRELYDRPAGGGH